MSKYSAIDTLECIIDGDTIVPGMNYDLPLGVGTTQYFDPSKSTDQCTPDYTKPANQIVIYPACYSSGQGRFLVPTSGQWHYDNPDSAAAAITDTAGNITSAFTGKFVTTTKTLNPGTPLQVTIPALKITDNFASATNLNDVRIYYKGVFNGINVLCHADFSIKETTGTIYDVVINCAAHPTNPSAPDSDPGWVSGDMVISDDNECLRLVANLQINGTNITTGVTWSWVRLDFNGPTPITTEANKTIVNGNRLVLMEAAVEGTEEIQAIATYKGNTYRKSVQVSDTHDPYFINIGRDVESNLIKEDQTVTYTPTVVSRDAPNTPLTGWNFAYGLYRNDGTQVRTANGNSLTVPGTEVKSAGGLVIIISATNP